MNGMHPGLFESLAAGSDLLFFQPFDGRDLPFGRPNARLLGKNRPIDALELTKKPFLLRAVKLSDMGEEMLLPVCDQELFHTFLSVHSPSRQVTSPLL